MASNLRQSPLEEEDAFFPSFTGEEAILEDEIIPEEEVAEEVVEDENAFYPSFTDGVETDLAESIPMEAVEEDTFYPSFDSTPPKEIGEDFLGETARDKLEKVDVITNKFFELPAVQNSIQQYLVGRDGKSGARQADESEEDYAERYFTHMRWLETNLYSTGTGISWLGQAKGEKGEAAKDNFAALYTAYKEMPGAFSEGGGDAWSAVQDYIYASVLDPTNVATIGAGLGLKIVGGRMVGQILLRDAIKANAGKLALSGATDTLVGAIQEGALQTVEQRADMIKEKDWRMIAAMGVLSGGLGSAFNVASLRQGANNVDYQTNLKRELSAKRVEQNSKSATVDIQAQIAAESFAEGMTNRKTVFDPVRAKALLAGDTPSGLMAEAILKTSVSKEVQQMAGKLMEAVPSYRPMDHEKISDGLLDVIANVMNKETIDSIEPLLENSVVVVKDLRKLVDEMEVTFKEVGITTEEFAQMTRSSYEASGTYMQVAQAIGGNVNRAKNLTPEEMKMLDPKFAEDMDNWSWFKVLLEGAKNWDRNRRAIMTSMPVTTVRNVASASGYIGLETGQRLIIESISGIGRAAKAASVGNFSVKGTADGVTDVVKNSFSLFYKTIMYGDSKVLSEAILAPHPRLQHILLRTTNEAGTSQLATGVRALNSLNIAQDQFMRSGVFVDSIERQLKLIGLDSKAILAANKQIPAPVVKRAIDDALVATFSAPAQSTIAKTTLAFVENLPFVATSEFPFVRFMMNAVNFQYKYSPLNIFSTANRYRDYRKLLLADNPASERLKKEAADEFGRTVVGTAALYAAIKYRKENQDTNPLLMRNENGSTTNVAALFPLPGYLVVADLLVKFQEGRMAEFSMSDFGQGIVGLQKAPFAGSARMFSELSDMGIDQMSTEDMGDMVGKWVGSIFGQYMTPAKVVQDVMSAFDDEESKVRDPNVQTGEGFLDRAVTRTINEIQRGVPYWSQSLPTKADITRGGDQLSDFAITPQLMGVQPTSIPTQVENELEKYGFKIWQMGANTGDKQYDGIVNKYLSGPLNELITNLLNSEVYQNRSTADKKKQLDKQITKAKTIAKAFATYEAEETRGDRGFSAVERAAWKKVSQRDRGIANEKWLMIKAQSPSLIPKNGNASSTIEEDRIFSIGVKIARGLK